jgi:hypothetical protein
VLTLRRDALTRRKALLAEQLRRPGVTGEMFVEISQELAHIKLLELSIGTERVAGIALVPMDKKKAGPPQPESDTPNAK